MADELLDGPILDDLPPEPPALDTKPARISSWKSGLACNKRGEPLSQLANAIAALRTAPEWAGVLAYDEFAMTTQAEKPPPWQAGHNIWQSREWTPLDDLQAAEWLQHQGINVSPLIAGQAVQVVASDARFHPVRDYLGALSWDYRERVDTWLSFYLGAADTAYVRAVGAMMLIAGVARVMRPGCQADHVPIFEGVQGTGKSSALRILGGQWFTDEIADLGSKDAAMQTRGAWIIELAELDSMSKAEVSKVKAFISRTTDRFRPPYGARIIESPRECIFCGTTNKDSYLSDETGARRFWPVRTGRIELGNLARVRDQLWAEARARFDAGERWWLSGEALGAARDEQAERYIEDAWQPIVAAHISMATSVSVPEILGEVLNIEKARWTQSDQNRVARILRALNWTRRQVWTGDKRHWRYARTGDDGDR
jgi:predicted P-loop ATPase